MTRWGPKIALLCAIIIARSSAWGGPSTPSSAGLSQQDGRALGTVDQVVGDLVYVSGLNGSAPLWSRIKVIPLNGGLGSELQVIKELDRCVVARSLSGSTSSVRARDRVELVEMEAPDRPRSVRTVVATHVARGPKVDGILDDPAWQEAPPISEFVQREPDYWMPATEPVVARIVHDNDRVYFGFECACADPATIVANNMRRDSGIHSDDNVQILLDTYNDRQTGFFFFVNPLGAKRDLVLSNEGRTYNEDWDCVWEAKTTRHTRGWTAEIAIPFSQLRYRPGEDSAWGINLARHIASKSESAQLVVGRRSSTRLARYWTSDLAELSGLRLASPGPTFQLTPYILPGTAMDRTAPDPRETRTFEAGVDLRYGVTPNLTLDLSYNTDFAQVEGDQEQVNLTQFQPYFPEKRAFFLESASLFDFGEAAEQRGGDDEPPNLLFFSRRIGLAGGNRVPILLGTKLVGRSGRTAGGFLNVLTDSEQLPGTGDLISRSNFTVARVKRDILDRSNVGFIAVNKQTDDPASGWGTYNRAAGVDVSLSPSAEWNLQGFLARTWDSDLGRAGDGRFLQLRYVGNAVSGKFTYLDAAETFEPAVGFVNRWKGMMGFRRYAGRMRLRPRPDLLGIRYLSVTPSFEVITDRGGNVVYWEGGASWWTFFRSGDSYRVVDFERRHVVLDTPFRPSRRHDAVIPSGSYTFTTVSTGPSTSRRRKLRIRAELEAGSYYTGNRYGASLETYLRPTGRFSLETEYETNWLRLPQGNFTLQTLSNRLIYSFNPDFYIKLFSQFNNDRELVSANLLLSYQYRPGSHLFFLYDHAFGTLDGLEERSRAALLKLVYTLGI